MALRLASPGINIREVDLTRGSVNATSSLSAGIAAPFEKGPVEEVTEIRNENQLFETFGRPSKNDFHYEYWYSASNFLSYGGSLKVVRADSSNLRNSNAAVGAASSESLKIKNFEDFQSSSKTGYYWAAKTPGSWSDSIRVCVIDNFADQTLSGLSTSGVTVGDAVTQTVSSDEEVKGIVTGVGSSEFYVKVVEKINTSTGSAVITAQDYTERGKYSFKKDVDLSVNGSLGAGTTTVEVTRAGLGTEPSVVIGAGTSFTVLNQTGTTTNLQLSGGTTFATGQDTVSVASVSGITTSNVILIGNELFQVGGISGNSLTLRSGGNNINGYGTTQETHFDNDLVTVFDLQTGATEAAVEVSSSATTIQLTTIGDVTVNDYLIVQTDNDPLTYGEIILVTTVSNSGTLQATNVLDWYNTQSLLSTANGDSLNVLWRDVAPKPKTNDYVLSRNGGNDAFHLVVLDNLKGLNNNNNIPQERIETFLNLSKASDTKISPSEKIYYKDFLEKNSQYIYAGSVLGADSFWEVTPVASNFSSGNTPLSTSLGLWGQEASGVFFNAVGNKSFTLTSGKDYSGTNNVGGFLVGSSEIESAYNELSNENEVELNFLLQGGASGTIEDEQRKANYIINIAQNRKDCVAFISPTRSSVVTPTTQAQKLEKILEFFTPLSSSSYAVFDSGYQYVFDRFNNEFVYMPCSGDIAGLCVRTDIDQFPWFSPAGKVRGTLNNVIKLAYNPNQSDRDSLYSNRINPVITSPGSGTILFGDKTALSFSSAFDRINVRRLFITIEQAIRSAADAQLFEFNDSSTRANFVNIVDPYLRDVQAKRGITDFLLICDESNNTPAVIDRNEFIADIYVKPARSINFIGLTFVATRTGVSFQTVAGTV